MKKTGVMELVSSKDLVKGGDRDSVNFGPSFSSTKHLLGNVIYIYQIYLYKQCKKRTSILYNLIHNKRLFLEMRKSVVTNLTA